MSYPIDLDAPVRVTHLPTHGRGQHVEFTGDDGVAVLARATAFWAGADPWLRQDKPVLRPMPDGTYAAAVKLWSAE